MTVKASKPAIREPNLSEIDPHRGSALVSSNYVKHRSVEVHVNVEIVMLLKSEFQPSLNPFLCNLYGVSFNLLEERPRGFLFLPT